MANKGKQKKEGVQRIEIGCIFRGEDRTREFTTPANFEAVNMLKNKLDRKGIKNQEGKLIFEFKTAE